MMNKLKKFIDKNYKYILTSVYVIIRHSELIYALHNTKTGLVIATNLNLYLNLCDC